MGTRFHFVPCPEWPPPSLARTTGSPGGDGSAPRLRKQTIQHRKRVCAPRHGCGKPGQPTLPSIEGPCRDSIPEGCPRCPQPHGPDTSDGPAQRPRGALAWGPGRSAGIIRRWDLRGEGGGQGLPPPLSEKRCFLRVSGHPGRCFRRVPPEPPGRNKTCPGPPVTEWLPSFRLKTKCQK